MLQAKTWGEEWEDIPYATVQAKTYRGEWEDILYDTS